MFCKLKCQKKISNKNENLKKRHLRENRSHYLVVGQLGAKSQHLYTNSDKRQTSMHLKSSTIASLGTRKGEQGKLKSRFFSKHVN